jgi:hypothetical protein
MTDFEDERGRATPTTVVVGINRKVWFFVAISARDSSGATGHKVAIHDGQSHLPEEIHKICVKHGYYLFMLGTRHDLVNDLGFLVGDCCSDTSENIGVFSADTNARKG